MAVGQFLHILESNLLKVVDPATPPGKTRYLAQQLGLVWLRALGWGVGGGVWLQGRNPGSRRAKTRLSVTESRCLRGHVSQRHSQHFYLSSCHTCPTMF